MCGGGGGMNAFPACIPSVLLKSRPMLGAPEAAVICGMMRAQAQGWGISWGVGMRSPAQGQAWDASSGY